MAGGHDRLTSVLSGALDEKRAPQPVSDAVSALVNLGYAQPQAAAAVAASLRGAGEGAEVKTLIRLGLKEHSTTSFCIRSRSRSATGICTVNGTSRSLRRIASSRLVSRGLWLPQMNSLKPGTKSKKSCRMNRAVILSPPVSALILV